MDDSIKAVVQCLCGRSNFQTDIDRSVLPIKAHLCHCNICRRTHGILHTYHAPWPSQPDAVINSLKSYKSSERVVRYFCSTCGAHMLDVDVKTGEWMVSTPLVKQAKELFVFDEHIFIEDTNDGGLSDLLPSWDNKPLRRFAADSASTSEVAPFWTASKISVAPPTSSPFADKLYCHCHCKGTAFYISRPRPGYKTPDPGKKYNGQFDPRGGKWPATNCVCNDCRLAGAADLFSWLFVPPASISLPDGSAMPQPPRFGSLTEHQSSKGVRRYFCGKCGATVFFDSLERPAVIDVAVGIVDARSGTRAEEWLAWIWDKPDYGECAANSKMYEEILRGYKRWNEKPGVNVNE